MTVTEDKRNAMNVAKRFGHKDQKYSDSDEKNIEEFMDQYMAASRDFRLQARNATNACSICSEVKHFVSIILTL